MYTDAFFPFLLTALVIEMTPGPNMAWLALTAVSAGRRVALVAMAGIAAGLALIGLLAALGLAELAQQSPTVFFLLRYAGAAYLLWLAWEAWTTREGDVSADGQGGFTGQWFRRGLLINLFNPKAALFFVAILPNYVDTGRAVMAQTLFLSGVYVAIATLVHLALVVFASQAHDWFGKGANAARVRKTCAVMIAAVALWFLVATSQ